MITKKIIKKLYLINEISDKVYTDFEFYINHIEKHQFKFKKVRTFN